MIPHEGDAPRVSAEMPGDAEFRLDAVLALASIGTWIWDVQKDWVVGDRNLIRMFSVSPEDAGGAPIERYLSSIHPEDRSGVRHLIDAVLAGRHGQFEMDYRIRRPDGEIRWIVARGAVQWTADGKPGLFPGVAIDITDRKNAEEVLRETAQRLQLTLAAGDLGDWSWDAATDITTLSPRALEIFGLPPGTRMTREQLRQRLLPDDADLTRRTLAEAVRTRTDYVLEYRIVRPSGEHRWVAARGRASYGAGGNVVSMIGVVQDITARKNAEVASHRLAAIVASSGDAIVGKTLDSIVTSWNEAAERMFGYTAEEMIGQSITRLFSPAQADEEPAIIERLRNGERIDHYETVRVRKDGSLVDVSLSVSPIRDASGKVIGASKIARDITEQKRVGAALKAADTRFRIMADSAPVLIWMADTTKACTWFNRPWLEFTGRSAEEESGFGWIQNVHSDDLDARLRAFTDAFDARAPFKAEYRLRRYDGEWRWVLDTGVPLVEGPDNSFSGYIGSCIDVTEFRHASLEREQLLQSERFARTEAERLGRMKDEFLATLSHELRTPLNAILGWATLLRRLDVGSADHVRGLETIERNARVQTQIIGDLLDMSRIISGKVQLDVQPVDLQEVISASIDSVRPSVEAKGIRLRTTLAQVGRVRGDPNRLQQIFWNLLTNAVKFTPSGGRIDIVLERVNSHVEVSVEDTGIGIKPEFLAFVFDRFRQADPTITRRHGGLGLGLSIVKHLAELHGGSVRVKSAGEGQGSTFIIALPISVVRKDEPTHERHYSFADADLSSFELPTLTNMVALIVDDEPDARVLIQRLIEERGGRAVAAPDAQTALKLLSSQPFDILVSDIGMPGMDGYQLIQQVRSLESASLRKLPAIALTAYARAEDRQRALLAGYQMHLAKPVDPTELIAGMATLLNRQIRL